MLSTYPHPPDIVALIAYKLVYAVESDTEFILCKEITKFSERIKPNSDWIQNKSLQLPVCRNDIHKSKTMCHNNFGKVTKW